MQYKLTARFIFSDKTRQTVEWLESDLFKKQPDGQGGIIEVPLSVEEVEMHFRNIFTDAMNKKTIMSIPTVKGPVEFIPFNEVFRMGFKVMEHVEGEPEAGEPLV